jgi:hypothetical protein
MTWRLRRPPTAARPAASATGGDAHGGDANGNANKPDANKPDANKPDANKPDENKPDVRWVDVGGVADLRDNRLVVDLNGTSVLVVRAGRALADDRILLAWSEGPPY